MKVQEVLDRTVRFFREKSLDSPRLDAELLMAKALGLRRIDLYLKFDQPLGEAELGSCRELVRRRAHGEPVAYILGKKDFYGLTFQVDSRVLVPRPETEILAEAAIEFLKKDAKSAPKILDLGAGSGCLGLSILAKTPGATLVGVDLSPEALEVARQNAESLGLFEQCQWVQVDASQLSLNQSFNVIVANPPYISPTDSRVQDSVAKYEPKLALYAEENGFQAIRQWAKKAITLLDEDGFMGFEFGIDQETLSKDLFESLGLESVRILNDLSGMPRHVIGRKGKRHG